ncbi:MAG: hypothetical protein IT376_17095 [Polyangiaceae bacterium]|nr:hypothetical protein [Polyangiaceae bacterium]
MRAGAPPGGLGRWGRVALVGVLLAFCMGPVPGDGGGCGQPAVELDPETFFRGKAAIECERCTECGLLTESCRAACELRATRPTAFDPGCFPLVHDGEVCLRALYYAPCDELSAFVRDVAPLVPTECDFCPPGGRR